MGGEPGREVVAQHGEESGCAGGAGLLRHDVGDEALVAQGAGDVVPGDYCGVRDACVLGEPLLDLARFDADAADLDLVVGAPDVQQAAVRGAAHGVTGAVHPGADGSVGVGHEAFGTESGQAHVAAGHTGACDVQITVDAVGDGTQTCVQDVQADAGQGAADGRGGAGPQRAVGGGDDADLGRAVGVAEPAVGAPAVHEALSEGLARDQQRAHGDQPVVVGDHAEDGRRELQVGDRVPCDEVLESRAGQQPDGGGDDETGPRGEGRHDLPGRDVEADRGELQQTALGGQAGPAEREEVDRA
ncbi:hypothetical protein EES44_18380 [Streptomyces sp. ADI96-15]|nr:hypothetical protein EES44_18380 [Streptomyces sp. ADI96-15]